MAEPDYDDEELFADLYTDDAQNNFPALTNDIVEEEPTSSTGPAQSAAQAYPEFSAPAVDNSNSVANGDAGYNGTEVHHGGYGDTQPMKTEDEDAPIGIKEDGKMFIGGLNWETTDESLKNYFSQFGKVVECTVMRDGATGRSRGFGFLTFEDPKVVNTVMVKEHYLDGKIIDPKRAIPREEQERTAKIFVGGVHHDAREAEFRDFFKQFGRVVDATLMMDKDTGHPRGFGFVTFDGEEAVERCLSQPLAIRNKPIEVKRAEPRGNLHDEGRGKFGKRGDRFGRDMNQDMGSANQQTQGQMGEQGGASMSPSQMAKYWQMMQAFFTRMQQQMAMQMAQNQGQMGGMPGMGNMNMNPQMMQQMAQMQQMMNQQRMQGTQSPQGMQGMDPAMMQQMQQQMMAGMAAGGGPQGGFPGPGSPMGGAAAGPNKPGFSAQEQNMFEQQKYEQQQAQQAARIAQQQFAAQQGSFGHGGPTSWEGMYDDVPQPNPPPSGPRHAGPIRGHQNRGGGQQQKGGQQHQGQTPPAGPSNAPANAPTGPKNAGKPGANYRPGAHRGGRRFQPY